jgi:hypothetical protein
MKYRITTRKYYEGTGKVIAENTHVVHAMRTPQIGEASKTLMTGSNIITEVIKVEEVQ